MFVSFFGSAFFAVFAGAVFVGLTAPVFEATLAGALVETFETGGTVSAEFVLAEFAAELASTFELVFAAGVSVEVSGFEVRTETPPVRAGIESINAESIKSVAAMIVVFDKTVAVPRVP